LPATAEHSWTNLEKAREVRAARVALKYAIKAGEVSAARILEDPPPYAENITVVKFLSYIHGVKLKGALRAMRRCGFVAPTETLQVKSLSPSTRARLAEFIRTDLQPIVKRSALEDQ
jgi:hypothetical protein